MSTMVDQLVRTFVEPARSLWGRRARAISLAYLWLGLAAASVTVAGAFGSSILVLIAGGALFVALVRLGRVIRNDHDHDGANAKRSRWWTRVVLVAILTQLVTLSQLMPAVADELEFLALVTGFVLLSSSINELRFSHWPNGWRGPVVMAATGALIVVALWLVPATSASLALKLVAGAMMLGHLGIVIGSEDRIDQLVNNPSQRALFWPVTIAGVAFLIAGFVLLRGSGLPVSYALGTVAAFVLLIATAASKGDGDLLAIIVAITLIWAAAPRTVAPPENLVDKAPFAAVGAEPGANPDAGASPAVLVVGDSFISGEGARRFIDGTNERNGNTCRQASSSWAVRVAEESDVVPNTVIFRACSGARTPAIDTSDQLANLDEFNIELVIVSVGGNDAGFARLGQACLAPGNCADVAQSLRDRLALGNAPPGVDQARIPVEEAVVGAYRRIRAAVGDDAVIVAVPYPRAIKLPGCDATLLRTNEHHFLDAYTGELNAVIRSAAAREGVIVLDDMENALVEPGLQLCEGGQVSDRGLNFLAASPMTGSIQDTLNPSNWLNNSMHPNERGHDAMLDAAVAWFDLKAPLHTPTRVDQLAYEVASVADLTDDAITCADVETADLDCTDSNAPNRWLLRQTVLALRSMWWRIALVALGAWLATTPAIAEAHRREWTTVRVTDWVRTRFMQLFAGKT